MELAKIPLKPLYRMTLSYKAGWQVALSGPEDLLSQHFYLAQGTCDGLITGTFQAANRPLLRPDGAFTPDVQGVIETDDGAIIYFDHRGYGRAYPEKRRQVVVTGTHISDDIRYRWLNDVVTVGVGEVRVQPEGGVVIVIDWSEVLWTAVPD